MLTFKRNFSQYHFISLKLAQPDSDWFLYLALSIIRENINYKIIFFSKFIEKSCKFVGIRNYRDEIKVKNRDISQYYTD